MLGPAGLLLQTFLLLSGKSTVAPTNITLHRHYTSSAHRRRMDRIGAGSDGCQGGLRYGRVRSLKNDPLLVHSSKVLLQLLVLLLKLIVELCESFNLALLLLRLQLGFRLILV